jgi:RNA polymerase sigma factor (sigma-70 family)
MDPQEHQNRLSRIMTFWTKVFQAHQATGQEAQQAQRELLLRYYGAVYRYMLGTLRDANAAEELTQEFALRFLRGDFKRADPDKGRFRDFLKTALRHLAIKYWDKKKREKDRGPQALPEDNSSVPDPIVAPAGDDRAFLAAWRDELMHRAWEALRKVEETTGTPCYTVMRLKTEQPDLRSAQLAEQLGPKVGRAFTEDGVRQTLKRARDKFADLLLDEVERSLPRPGPDLLEQELVELELLEYCKSALKRRGESTQRKQV